MTYTAPVRDAILCHAQEAWPQEACGLLLQPPGDAPALYRPCANLQDSEPVADPDGTARGAETAFHLDGREVLRAEREGLVLRAIVHSHPEHDAYFSEMDRKVATLRFPGEPPEPAFPGVSYLVVSVRAGRAVDERWFAWDAAALDFAEATAP